MTTLLQIDTIVLADFMRQIGEQGYLDIAQAALLPGRIDPSQVRKVRVNAGSNHLSLDLTELGNAIGEGNYLRGTHKCAAKSSKLLVKASPKLRATYKSSG